MPNKFLSTVQIGITLIGIPGIYSGDKITTDVETFIAGFAILMPYAFCCGNYRGIINFFLGFRELLLKNWFESSEAIAKAAMPMKMVSVCAVYLVVDQCTEFY
jgi:putative hemolysin